MYTVNLFYCVIVIMIYYSPKNSFQSSAGVRGASNAKSTILVSMVTGIR